METLMEKPDEDPPLDLEEYDDADHPINETENSEVNETVGVPNQPTTRVWMIEVAEANLPEKSRKILCEPLSAVTIKNSTTAPGTILSTRTNGPENTEVEETMGGQKQPSIELREMIHLTETILFEDNRKAPNEQQTSLALNAVRALPVTVLKNKDHSLKESETNKVREIVEVLKQLSNDVQVEELAAGTDLSEDNHKIFSELNETTLPGTFAIYQDQPINRSETTEVQGTVDGQKQPPIEVRKIQGVDANRSEDYRKAVTEFAAALDSLKPFSGKMFNRQDSSTKASGTTKTSTSEGNRKTLTEQLENALEATRTHNIPDTISRTQNNKGCGIIKVPENAEIQKQPIINVHMTQVIETALPKDDIKAVFTEQLTAYALDAVRNYAHQNLNAPNQSMKGPESTKVQNKPYTQVPVIQVMDVTLSEDNRKVVTELKTALAGMRTICNGQDSSTKGPDTTDVQETDGVPKKLCVYVTQLVEFDTSQISNEDLRVALEAIRNLPVRTSDQYPKKRKSKAKKRRRNILSTCMMVSVFAVNIFAFAVGFGYGWWSRHALPNFSVYELHLDPTLF